MKKLLGIIVLGLLLSGNAYAKNVTILFSNEKEVALLSKQTPLSDKVYHRANAAGVEHCNVFSPIVWTSESLEINLLLSDVRLSGLDENLQKKFVEIVLTPSDEAMGKYAIWLKFSRKTIILVSPLAGADEGLLEINTAPVTYLKITPLFVYVIPLLKETSTTTSLS